MSMSVVHVHACMSVGRCIGLACSAYNVCCACYKVKGKEKSLAKGEDVAVKFPERLL